MKTWTICVVVANRAGAGDALAIHRDVAQFVRGEPQRGRQRFVQGKLLGIQVVRGIGEGAQVGNDRAHALHALADVLERVAQSFVFGGLLLGDLKAMNVKFSGLLIS